ncbi:MAG: UDP-N-acetylglucosamine 1-carboxyvinyltransferase [Myxococcota bacterium]
MEVFIIKGGQPLKNIWGAVPISGSKNAYLPIMVLSLLAEGESRLHNVPDLADVQAMSELLQALGVKVHQQHKEGVLMRLDAQNIIDTQPPFAQMRKMRASMWALGALLARCGHAKGVVPGGCNLNVGPRSLDIHMQGFQALGAQVYEQGDTIELRAPKEGLRGADISLRLPSVGATLNLMMAACAARGTTTIRNAAQEPEVMQVGQCLRSMGANIQGEGGSRIDIHGPCQLRPFTSKVYRDRLETATFIAAAAITGGDVQITQAPLDQLDATLQLFRQMGCVITLEKATDSLHVKAPQRLQAVDACTAPYPGFATDVQPLLMACAALAEGTSTICETLYDNRLSPLATQLQRMGAHIEVQGNTARVHGQPQLQGACVQGADLRACAALVLAGLAAQGVTRVAVQHLDRGYMQFEKKLQDLGAEIARRRHAPNLSTSAVMQQS